MFQNLKMKFIYFMQGRNGPDSLYVFLTGTVFVILMLNLLLDSVLLSALYLALFAYSLFRLFSKNIYRRRMENAKFLKIKSDLKGFFSIRKKMWNERKTHIYKKCPKCKKRLRLPRKQGEHTVKCPICGERFEIKVK